MEENGALVTVWTTGDRFERAGYGSFPVRTKRETPRGTRNFRGKLILVRKREDSRVNSGFEIVTVEKLESYEAVFTICSTGSVSTRQALISYRADGGRCSR